MNKSDQEQTGNISEPQTKTQLYCLNLLFKPSIFGSGPHHNMAPLPIWNLALSSRANSEQLKCGQLSLLILSQYGHP